MNGTVNAGNFLQVVNLAFFDKDETTRATNEEAVTALIQSQTELFVTIASSFFSDPKTPFQLRQSIGTILRLAVKPVRGNEHLSIWNRISAESKLTIQKTGLANLMDGNELVKRSAASLIACVFAVDCMNEKSWANLLPILKQNIEHSDPQIQKSSITTLGFICEVLHCDQITNLSNEEIDSMISGVCLGLKNYNANTLTALKALEFSVSFLKNSLCNETVADYIMNLLVTILMEANQRKDLDMIKYSILCLSKISEIIFGAFEKYHSQVFGILLDSYLVEDRDVMIAVNEFYVTLLSLEREHEAIRYFLSRPGSEAEGHCFAVKVLERVLESLIKLYPEEMSMMEPHETSELQNSCLILMGNLNWIYFEQIFSHLLNFIGVFIEKEGVVYKCSALLALESFLDMTPNEKVFNLFLDGFFGIIDLFSKEEMYSKVRAGKILAKVAKKYPFLFMEDRNFSALYPIMMREFEPSRRNFAVCHSVSRAFDALATQFEQLPKHAQNQLIMNHEMIIEQMMASITPTSEIFFTEMIQSATMSMMKTIVPPGKLLNWFIFFWGRFEQTLPRIRQESGLREIEGIFINLNIIVQASIKVNRVLDFEGNREAMILRIYDEVLALFKNIKEIIPDALLTIISLIEMEPDIFSNRVDDLIVNYLGQAIQNRELQETFRVGIDAIGQLTKTYKHLMEQYMNKLFPFIIESLQDPTLPIDTKIHMFFTVADISAHCPNSVKEHIHLVLGLIEMAFEAVVHLSSQTDRESLHSAVRLKETLLDLCSCIVHGMYYDENAPPQEMDLLRNFFIKYAGFLEATVPLQSGQQIQNPEYLRDILFFLNDIYAKSSDQRLFFRSFMLQVYESVRQFGHMEDFQEVLQVTKMVLFQETAGEQQEVGNLQMKS